MSSPDSAVFSTLLSSGLPGTKYAYPIGGAPPLPWFTYKRRKGGEIHADDTNYTRMYRYQVDLYQAEPDDEVRDAFEETLLRLGPFDSHEVWIPTENCWETSYTLTYHHTVQE